MRPRPQILLDALTGAMRALSSRAADEGRYEEFVIGLQEQGAYDEYVQLDDALEARLQGQPCPGCGDQPGAECALCGWTPEQLPPPGWYSDPELDGYRRYWTGQRWDGDPVEIMYDDETEVHGVYEPVGWRD